MVAIDGPHNGWRYLVLPIAHTDDLVVNSVLAVSALHISVNEAKKNNIPSLASQISQGPSVFRPDSKSDRLYMRAILGLQQRQHLVLCSESERHTVLLAILILLVAVMVTSSDDFPTLFRMLLSALDAIGGENGLGGGELAQFLIRQIRK